MDSNKKARLLSRKQKRLNYWREAFESSNADEEDKIEISGLLDTYGTLLARIAREEDCDETVAHLEKVEREINTKFENLRLRTSKLFESANS